MPDLNSWIKAQLKRGVSASRLKTELRRRKYPQSAISQVDIINSSLPDVKKSPFKILGFIMIFFIIIVIIIVNPNIVNKNSIKDDSTSKVVVKIEDSGLSLPNLVESPLCDNFEVEEGDVPCNRALTYALSNSPGKLQKMDIGVIRIPDIANIRGRIDVDAWLFDIKLDKPLIDDELEGEITFVRVGIGIKEHTFVHTQFLE